MNQWISEQHQQESLSWDAYFAQQRQSHMSGSQLSGTPPMTQHQQLNDQVLIDKVKQILQDDEDDGNEIDDDFSEEPQLFAFDEDAAAASAATAANVQQQQMAFKQHMMMASQQQQQQQQQQLSLQQQQQHPFHGQQALVRHGGLQRHGSGSRSLSSSFGALARSNSVSSSPMHFSQSISPPSSSTVCKFFLQGNCRNGVDCPYLHPGQNDRQHSRVCKFFLQGNCRNGAECPYFHPQGGSSPSTRRSRFDSGNVSGSSDDAFWQNEQTSSSSIRDSGGSGSPTGVSPQTTLQRSSSSLVCPFWQRGGCKFGSSCRFKHEEPAYATSVSTAPNLGTSPLSGSFGSPGLTGSFGRSGSGRNYQY